MTDVNMKEAKPAGWPTTLTEIPEAQPEPEKSEVHLNFDQTLDGVHGVVNKRLDELQGIIDELRLMMADDTNKIKSQVGKHLNAAEAALKLSDDVRTELEAIKKSLNGE